MSDKLSLSAAQEDYLKQIYLLGEQQHEAIVTTQALAQRLAVRPPSVTGMLKKLDQQQLVEHVPYRGVRLTDAGRRVALRLLRSHRLLEAYLHDALGYGWDEVHEEAERLEHVISEQLETRIARVLGDPTHDPHGDPIPSAELDFPESAHVCLLTRLDDGERARIVRVTSQDRDTLNLLARLGLTPGVEIEVCEAAAGGVRIEIGGQRFLLPAQLAAGLLVERRAQAAP
ncbi:MAG: metal-dependent transcriptional regulator [Acidobacteriota bacterium]|nr:MAG: metal-dependent transcriptional regulator [Acidobacteriota bacterium]